ncbi:MAG: hypothetical protein AB7N76_22465 [Planctomycetota bacterium]
MARVSVRLLIPLALLSAASGALADEGAWALGDEKLRYDLRPGAPPAGAMTPQIAEHQLVCQADFSDGHTPRLAVSVPGDLVWHFALRLPALDAKQQKKAGRPLTLELTEKFPLKRGAYEVKGNQSVRIKGKRWMVRSSLLITPTEDGWFKKGNLVTTSTFDFKKGTGRLEQASYVFEVTGTTGDPKDAPRTDTWQGTIEVARPVRVLGKDFHVEVQQAIERGTAWLKKETQKRVNDFKAARQPYDQRLGMVALPCFALLRSGVPPRELQDAFVWCSQQPLEATYSVALWVMLLEARSVKRTALAPRAHTRSVTRFDRGQLPAPDKELMRRAVEWLVRARKAKEGWWSYYGSPAGADDAPGQPLGHDKKTPATSGDRSNSQFAVLALHSALASDVPVPAEVWLEVTREALGAQDAKGPEGSLAGSVFSAESPYAFDPRDQRGDPNQVGEGTRERAKEKTRGRTVEVDQAHVRGWAYGMTRRPSGGAYGSMTAAGVSTLAICYEGLRRSGKLTAELEGKLLRAMRDGLCWLLQNFDATRNPKHDVAAWYFYWIYSLEKAMDTSGVERLGLREWWRDAAAELLARQDDKGSWGSIEDTSFALLVLNRATLPAKLEISEAERKKTGADDPSRWDVVVIDGVGQLSLRQLLQTLADSPESAPERLELARKGFEVLPEPDRPRLVPELALLVEHRHKPTRKWAREQLRACTGGEDPGVATAFVQRWEAARVVGEAMDYGRLPELQEILRDPRAPLPLLGHALVIAGRLRALEVVEDVVALLDSKEQPRRELAWSNLVTMVEGGAPSFAPAGSARERGEQVAAWRAWWKEQGPRQLQAEHMRRWVEDLGYAARSKSAEKQLVAVGRPAVRPLIDALRAGSTRVRAHKLLVAITGQKLGPEVDPWLAWVEGEEKRAPTQKN